MASMEKEQASSGLQRVIALSEEVKAVAEVSRRLGLEAINAMLVARRAGDSVRGFGVVSTELRQFSAALESQMQILLVDIARLVHGVAGLAREDRMCRQLGLAGRACGDCASLKPALARVEGAAAAAADASRQDWDRVQLGIRRSIRLCDTGRALARGARIEAVYGAAMAGELGQAGQAIERSIERIRDRLLVGVAITETMQ
jgi:hypothetical protein